MKRIWILIIVLAVMTLGITAGAVKKFGKEITVEKITVISEILEKPADFLNKTVKIEGDIVGVCAHKGCWMSLASNKEFQTLRVKVKDGDMVFPLTAKGKRAVVEGSLYKIDLTKEQCIAMEKHKCQQENKKFDPSKITEGKTIYQFKPVAVIIK